MFKSVFFQAVFFRKGLFQTVLLCIFQVLRVHFRTVYISINTDSSEIQFEFLKYWKQSLMESTISNQKYLLMYFSQYRKMLVNLSHLAWLLSINISHTLCLSVTVNLLWIPSFEIISIKVILCLPDCMRAKELFTCERVKGWHLVIRSLNWGGYWDPWNSLNYHS